MKLGLGFEIIASYKRLSYQAWYALAEFVDNSTQSYENHKPELQPILDKENTILTVKIDYIQAPEGNSIVIEDNSIGMTKDDLENAIIIGKPTKNSKGRSKYGLGLKTASFWFGNEWSVTTKRLGETVEHTVTVHVDSVMKDGTVDYKESKTGLDKDAHYTIVTIWNLNQQLYTTTVSKVKEYLKSIYRVDLSAGTLDLQWKGESLEWDNDKFFGKFVTDDEGKELKRDINLTINGKIVTGWCGVLEKGTRAKAGFSILKSNRVITGWPQSYRPESLFGAQEGGVNDLVNQRLTGELKMNDFEVSHTKDAIIFEEDDDFALDVALGEECGDLRMAALTHRKNAPKAVSEDDNSIAFAKAMVSLEYELSAPVLSDFLTTYEIPDEELIAINNQILVKNVGEKSKPLMVIQLGSLVVRLFITDEISFNDPYYAVSVKSAKDTLDVIVNKSHPYWFELKEESSILDYLRQCVYDGVAEWKAFKLTGKVEPDTIKNIKDNLLRTPFKIRN